MNKILYEILDTISLIMGGVMIGKFAVLYSFWIFLLIILFQFKLL